MNPRNKEFINSRNLKYMGLSKKTMTNPLTVSFSTITDRIFPVENSPLFTKVDSLDGINAYVVKMAEIRIDVLSFGYEDLAQEYPLIDPSRGKWKETSEGPKPTKKKMKQEKAQASRNISLASYPEPSTGVSKFTARANKSLDPPVAKSLTKIYNELSPTTLLPVTSPFTTSISDTSNFTSFSIPPSTISTNASEPTKNNPIIVSNHILTITSLFLGLASFL